MKRLASIFLCLVLLLPVVSFAAVDFHSMSDDEILECKSAVAAEIMSRGLMKSATIPAGTYIIGSDIPAGDYTLTVSDPNISIVGKDVKVYASQKDADAHKNSLFYKYMYNDEQIGKLSLKDTNILILECRVILSQYAGIVFQ